MPNKLFFINEDPQEVAKVLSRLKPGSIENACLQKGYPPASNANRFCVTFGKDGMNLCYKFFNQPTSLLGLHRNELPKVGWRLVIIEKEKISN